MTALRRCLMTFASAKRGLSTIEWGLFAALIVGAVLLAQAITINSNCSDFSLGSNELKFADQDFQTFLDYAKDIPSRLFCR